MPIRTLLSVVGLVALICSWVSPARAQQTEERIADELLPIREPVEPPASLYGDLFDVSTTLELGGQFARVRGNNEVYRSHLNFSDGFRLFNFQTRGQGREGAFLSDFYLQMGGWGGDPQNWARFGASKDKWFDFKGQYRRQDYFWVFPGFARNQHRNDQERRLQSYDLTLLPRRPLRFKLGYTRNSSFGLALTTQDFSRDEFLVFEPIRNTYDEYRAGVEATYQRWNFFVEQGYRFLRNDRLITSSSACGSGVTAACVAAGTFDPGNDAGDPTVLTNLERNQPIRDRIKFTRATVVGRPRDDVEVTARVVHSDIDTDASRFERLFGSTFTGVDAVETFATLIEADRPYTTVDTSATWQPYRRLTVSNHFRFDQWNLGGAGTFTDFTFFPLLGSLSSEAVIEQRQLNLEGYRNRLEGRYDLNRFLSVRGGFEYQHRDVELVEWEFECADPGTVTAPFCPSIVDFDEERERIDLNSRSFLLGVIARPLPTLSLFFDLERGNATGVFTRLSANNVDRIRVRSKWEPTTGVRLMASWFVFDNTNLDLPIQASGLDQPGQHSVRNRGVSVDFQFFRFPRGYLNLGYSRNDVTAQSDVLFFPFFTPTIGRSLYVANDNYIYIDFGGRIAGNLWGDAGYRVVTTSGTFPPSDPVRVCDPFVPGSCDNTGGLAPLSVNPFGWGGLNYHQPHAALRYEVNETVSWKGGWRWYGYNQKLGTISDYKAHIITTSLVLTF